MLNPSFSQSMMIHNKVVKPIELVLLSENDTDINGESRDSLEIFDKRFDDSEKEPYISRKISRDDGLIYYLNKKPPKIENFDVVHHVLRKLRMMICITMSDESERKLTQTLATVYNNLESFCVNDVSPEDLAVVVVADGIQNLDKSMIEYFERLDADMGGPSLTVSSRLQKIQQANEAYVKEAKQEHEKKKRQDEVDSLSHFPKSIQKKTALCYQARCSAKDFPYTTLLGTKYDNVKLNIFFVVKMQSSGKLASHMWFFQGFCKLFNPDYCTILECGTKAEKDGIFAFFRALESDRDLGAVCGYATGKDYDVEYKKARQPPFKFSYDPTDNPIVKSLPIAMNFLLMGINFLISFIEDIVSLRRAQQFDLSWDSIYNKNFQSIFRYLSVLPSAWSAYRWDALCEDNLLEKEYLNTVKNPDYVYKSLKEANKILTEDRLLSLAIFTKRNRSYYLKYCPDARAEVDLINTIPELLAQMKRIINGGYYAIENILYYNNQIRYSKHSNLSKMMFSGLVFMSRIDLFILYMTPSIYFIALKIIMFEYMVNISIIANPASSLAGFFLFLFIGFMVTLIFISLQFKAVDKDISFFFRVLSHFMGIFMLLTFAVLLNLIANEIFHGQIDYFLSQTLIQAFVVAIFGSIGLVVLLNPGSWRHLLFGILPYLYYFPTYAHINTVYAFCRIDDLSFGSKGAHATPSFTQLKQFKDFKIEFVATWLIVNTLISYVVIVITSSSSNQGVFLTFMLFLMAVLMTYKAFWGCIYSLKYCLFDLKTHHEKIKEMRTHYKNGKEEIERYYQKIKFGHNIVGENDNQLDTMKEDDIQKSIMLSVHRSQNAINFFEPKIKSIFASRQQINT